MAEADTKPLYDEIQALSIIYRECLIIIAVDNTLSILVLLHQLYLAKKMKAERKFIKEGKCRNAVAFQVFLTPRNFLYAEYLMARFSWGAI